MSMKKGIFFTKSIVKASESPTQVMPRIWHGFLLLKQKTNMIFQITGQLIQHDSALTQCFNIIDVGQGLMQKFASNVKQI